MAVKLKTKYESRLFLSDPYHQYLKSFFVTNDKRHSGNFLGWSVSFTKKLRITYIIHQRLQKNLLKLKNIEFDEKKLEHNKLIVEIAGDIESFILEVKSFLDITAKLAGYFFKKHIKHFDSFTTFVNYEKWNTVDPEFGNYLKNNMVWYEKFNLKRGKIAHNYALDVFFNKDDKTQEFEFVINSFNEKDSEKGIENLQNFLNETISGFGDYIKFYIEHFEKMKSV